MIPPDGGSSRPADRRDPERPRVRVAAAEGYADAARSLAARLRLPLAPEPAAFEVWIDEGGLGLRPAPGADEGGDAPLRIDFAAARPGAEEVVRAVRGRRSLEATGVVADATAGLGTDAAALARAGLAVVLIERDPVLHAMLEDAVSRLAASAEPAGRAMAARMRLLHGDAAELLPTLSPRPGVVLLDPMYPDLGGGAKRRGMRWVRAYLGEASDGGANDLALLAAARRAAATRVVLKRPAKAPRLAPGVSGTLRGRTTRFDLYPPLPAGR